MIRWCAYCQRYQGEVEPFDDYSMTHTICADCLAREAHLHKEPAQLELIRRFFERVARLGPGSHITAQGTVSEGARLGLDPIDLLLGIIQPVLRQLGDRWTRSEATVSEEQQITERCSQVIKLIAASDAITGAVQHAARPAVLLAAAHGNDHLLGLQIVEVFLLRHRIATFTPACPVTPDDVLRLTRSLRPQVVALSAAMAEQVTEVQLVAERLSVLSPGERPLVVAGGRALSRPSNPLRGEPSVIECRDPQALVALVKRKGRDGIGSELRGGGPR